jgi:hypothetical protein
LPIVRAGHSVSCGLHGRPSMKRLEDSAREFHESGYLVELQ